DGFARPAGSVPFPSDRTANHTTVLMASGAATVHSRSEPVAHKFERFSGKVDGRLSPIRQGPKALCSEMGDRVVSDIDLNDVVRLQRKRLASGKSPRTINYEVHTLRLILKHFNLWWPLADKVRMLKGERRPGRALSREEESALIGVIRKSGS